MSAGTGWLLSAGQKQCLSLLAFFKHGVVLLFYGTTLLPAALLVLQVKVPLEGWVMGEFWTLWGLSTWSRTWLMSLSNLSWRKFSWERQTIHSYCSSKMPPLLCARAPPVIRAALFTSLVCWVHWLPDPVGCRVRHLL